MCRNHTFMTLLRVVSVMISAQLISICSPAAAQNPAPGSPQMPSLFEQMRQELGWGAGFSEGLYRPEDRTPSSRLKGANGVPFPKPEESVFKPYPTPEPSKDVSTPYVVPTAKPYELPRRCESDGTTRIVTDRRGTESDLYTDDLFIPEDLVPLEPEEVFGSKVSLVPYGPESGEASKIRVEIYRVPCVPYRIRVTNTTKYFDTGVNALKNYDQDQAGKGVLHVVMQQKLYPGKRSK